MKKKLSKIAHYYSIAHKERVKWFNWKWRLFCILSAALVIAFVYDYLQTKYVSFIVMELKDGELVGTEYSLADKLFNWFMTGALFGIIALGALYEGELLLGLKTLATDFEKEMDSKLRQTTSFTQKILSLKKKRK